VNHRIQWIVLLCLGLVGCAPSASSVRGLKAGDVQVVAQWVLPTDPKLNGGSLGGLKSLVRLQRYFRAEEAIEKASDGLYFEDGNDVGGRTFNVFIYTDRVDDSVARLIQLERSGKLPPGLRIGVAQYRDREHKDWDYKAYHPAGVTRFAL
jgi:hypothetical protein